MVLYVVNCEWDMGFNLDGYSGVYSSYDNRLEAMEEVDWGVVGENYEDLIDEGLVSLTTIEG